MAGPDLRRMPRDPDCSSAYGFLPMGLARAIINVVRKRVKSRSGKPVERDESDER